MRPTSWLHGLTCCLFIALTLHAGYLLWKWGFGLGYVLYSLFSAGGLFIFLRAFGWHANTRNNLTLMTLTSLIMLMVMNFLVVFIVFKDTRTKFDVVYDLRQKGINAYPFVIPPKVGTLPLPDGTAFQPLSSLASVYTVFCNESSGYVSYTSDGYGFRNPPELWKTPNPQVMVVGDSFTNGECMDNEQDFVSILRKQVPQTLNLGIAGSGPFTHLGLVREFVLPKRPRYLVWVYFEGNDIINLAGDNDDLDVEGAHPILSQYLNQADFRQNILEKQGLMNMRLAQRIEALYQSRAHLVSPWTRPLEMLRQQLLCRELRLLTLDPILKLLEQPHQAAAIPDPHTRQRHLARYEAILDRLLADLKPTGTQVVFLYLPEKSSVMQQKPHPYYQDVLALVQRKHIPVVDLYPTFLKHPLRQQLFPMIGIHYSSRGYALVGQQLSEQFENFGLHSPTTP